MYFQLKVLLTLLSKNSPSLSLVIFFPSLSAKSWKLLENGVCGVDLICFRLREVTVSDLLAIGAKPIVIARRQTQSVTMKGVEDFGAIICL